jgi:hypothetical protein
MQIIYSQPSPNTFPSTHNGGPPLEHVPAWGLNGIGSYFKWRAACDQAWKRLPRETKLRRLKKAEACGLTYQEYTLVILETGRFLQPDDTDTIQRIIARRDREPGQRR